MCNILRQELKNKIQRNIREIKPAVLENISNFRYTKAELPTDRGGYLKRIVFID